MSKKYSAQSPKIIVLVLLLAFLFVLSPIMYRLWRPNIALAFFDIGKILGDDDDESEDDSKDEEDSKDEKNDDEDEDDEDDDDDDDSDDDSKDDDEDEDEDDDSKDDDYKEYEKTVVSPNGSTTLIKQKTEDDGSVKYEVKLFDASGNKLEEREYEGDDEKEELQVKSYLNNNKISEIKYKSEDGEEVKLMIKEEDGSRTRLYYDEANQRVVVLLSDSNDEGEDLSNSLREFEMELRAGSEQEDDFDEDEYKVIVKARADKDAFEIEHLGVSSYTSLPVKLNDDTGEIYIVDGSSEYLLNTYPDEISEDFESKYDIEDVELEVKVEGNKLVYELDSTKIEKLLGLFEVEIPLLVTYDADTGTFLSSSQDFVSKVLDILSF